MMIYLITSL